MHRKVWALAYLTVLFFVLFPKPVLAYLDPGTGSYLFQLLIAGLLGGTFFLKGYLGKIKGFLKKGNKKQDSTKDESDE